MSEEFKEINMRRYGGGKEGTLNVLTFNRIVSVFERKVEKVWGVDKGGITTYNYGRQCVCNNWALIGWLSQAWRSSQIVLRTVDDKV